MVTQRIASITRRAGPGALAGLLAAGLALGVGQLVAGLTGPLASPVIAVGGAAVNLTPVQVKEFAIAHFGTHDKQVLITGVVTTLAVFAVLVGILARRRLSYGYAGLAVFACLGVVAAVTRPNATAVDAMPAVAGAVAAAFALRLLVRARVRPAAADGPALAGSSPSDGPAGRVAERPDRRQFLLLGAGTAAAAAVTGLAGQLLLRRFNVAALRAAVRLPRPARPATAIPAGAQLPVPGITPFVTSSSSFYRVDIDLVLPQISPGTWQLRVHGMVRKELEISFDDLLRRPLTEADITLTCVSNQVGGPLAGNARWLGASLAALLREAGVQPGADQILSSAATDGMSISTPLAAVIDDPDAMLAVGMNGQPLPVAHGFPVRMMVPGLYGYVSGTKWVTDLNITTFAAQQAYWTQRGYAQQAPMKTMSRIDVPKPLAQVPAGRTAVAGVAWAPTRGIDAVQVRADGGGWQQATLAAVPSLDTWRQWLWQWDATPGTHQLEVRATDGTGVTQTSRPAMPLPNGASGWDTTVVTVT
jgi:DMSO/TMAO reductase YedYZ molybdopterin-dependent catalytic subunit